MTGAARIVLEDGNVFEADRAELVEESGVLTATGRFGTGKPTVTRSWPMGQVRVVRWNA